METLWLTNGVKTFHVDADGDVAKRLLSEGYTVTADPNATPEPAKKPSKASKAATEAEG